MKQICPFQNKTGFVFIYSVIMTLIYPIGLPLLLLLVLQLNHVPSLAYDLSNTARLKGLFDICGMENTVNFEGCFLQNLLNTLGKDGFSNATGERSKTINFKTHESHNVQEEKIREMLDWEKIWVLHARLLRQFMTDPKDHDDLLKFINRIKSEGLLKAAPLGPPPPDEPTNWHVCEHRPPQYWTQMYHFDLAAGRMQD
eukprot:2613904-Rhodomonas_salina.1